MSRLQSPPHDLRIDEARFLTLLAGSLSLSASEKQRIIEAVPDMTQERYDRIIDILESEKMRFDALSRRGEQIRRFITSVRIAVALDWAQVKHGLSRKRP